ncbi:zinc-ribbon and DUF3426 domain-containing protein [Variovorax sp. PAMC 28711]|uniref:zinc-ribbon and DUF3426 domain-containing protein n=1 Tax=Variovorax sp. PAMC 28711 TaxID=1795631 RepID=UPI00078B37F7|nr:zinc-ribbon and DUF3426 domain-containing protein [Variovorax sp. PAMC 28711]AMM24080.1 hypothetical protein AX767_06770 [Variovorax sp. PAMC 28711]
MSLVTRCPACATTFKVVRDQLRISDGWVRCGRCSHVFDATLDLRDLSDTEATPPAAPAPDDADFFDDDPARDDAPAAFAEPAAPVDLPAPPSFPVLPDLSSPAGGLVADEPWPTPVIATVPDRDTVAPHPVLSVAELAPSLELDTVSQGQFQKALRRARVKAAKIARARDKSTAAPAVEPSEESTAAPVVQTASESEPPPLPPTVVPSFLRAASSSEFWQSARGRMVVVAGIVVAGLLLALQVVHRERDSLLAGRPGLRPVLQSLCAVTGCELAALRRINDITIDGATFAREKVGDGYQFSFTLRSAATVPLAMPAIELSLLNTQEQAVVRRVLLPTDFGAPAELAARGERAASLRLILTGAEAAALPPIAGFNVLAFYP